MRVKNPKPFTKQSTYDQFSREFKSVKDLNGKSCPFAREDEILDEELQYRSDKNFPIIRPKFETKLDFSSEILTSARGKLLNTENYGEYSQFDNAVRSCYIKDTIMNDKKAFFANTTIEKKISSGAYGTVAVYKDKATGLPIASGKFVVDYGFRYNKNFFETSVNFETVHEALIGLELVNKCKYFLPNYPSTYGIGYCDINKVSNNVFQSCRIKNNTTTTNDAPVVFIEYLNNSFTLREFLVSNKVTQTEILNNIQGIYLQVFNALNVLYMMNGCYTHYDLHYSNVLIRILDEEILIPMYIFGDDEILLEIRYLKTKYVAHIIDYGLSTFLSYETLSREFYQKSTKYYGKTREEIKKEFTFGNEGLSHYFDSKKTDPAFDIYKIIGFSSYEYEKENRYNFDPIKTQILRFFGIIYKLVFHEGSTTTSLDLIKKFLSQGEQRRLEYFSKPKDLNVATSYNFISVFLITNKILLSGAIPTQIYTESEIMQNPNLNTLMTSNCLNEACAIRLDNQFDYVFKENDTRIRHFFPAQLNELKTLLYTRRSNINNMIVALSQNAPQNVPQNVPQIQLNAAMNPSNIARNQTNLATNQTNLVRNQSNVIPPKIFQPKIDFNIPAGVPGGVLGNQNRKTLRLDRNLWVDMQLQIRLRGGKIYDFDVTLTKKTSGSAITDQLLQNPDIEKYLEQAEFNIYLTDDLGNYKNGEVIYDDDAPVNLEGIKYIVYEDAYKGFFGGLMSRVGFS